MMTYLESVAKTVNKLMLTNKKYFYIGEDVRSGQKGISEGFEKKYGKKRVLDMPISESAFCGFALGLAIAGNRPIVEFNFSGLIFVSMDQIFNQASKFKEMTGGKKNIPIIYLLPTGTKGGLACHHSDNPYSILAHLGIRSYMPTHSSQVENVFKLATSKNEPVAIFLPVEEFRNTRNLKNNKYNGIQKISENRAESNLKKNITIICTGTTVNKSLEAVKSINLKYRLNCSVYGLSDISLENKTKKIISQIKSKKFLIVDDSPYDFGVASQIELVLRRNKILKKDLIQSITRTSNFIPFNELLENSVRPTKQKIENKILKLLGSKL